MTDTATEIQQIAVARRFFEETDRGHLPFDLFTPDFEFYFPKFGVGRGPDEFREFGSGLGNAGYKLQHHRDAFKYLPSGNTLIIEGTTEGNDGRGRNWSGGMTAGGRFASIFEFDKTGLICRMFIYLDPDYTDLNQNGFHWQRAHQRW